MNESNSYPLVSKELIVLIIVGIWLLILTGAFWWMVSHYKRLVGKDKKADLKKILDDILANEIKSEKELARLDKEIRRLEEDGELHLQKLGVVRFNPFDETGGDHSFSLALLDAKDTGLVITGLHTRERTRVYVKLIKSGKSRYDLSNEEKRALKEAGKKQ